MVKRNKQHDTFRRRQEIKLAVSQLKLQDGQKSYLKNYASKHKNSILILFFFLFSQILVEVALLFYGRIYFKQIVTLLERPMLWKAFLVLLVMIGLYISVSYLAIKASRTILVEFINNIRENWFTRYLTKFSAEGNKSSRVKLLTKMTYHFSLVQMGFNQVLTNAIYTLFSLFIILAIIPTIAPRYLILVPVILLVYILIIGLGYYISYKYVSKEQTLSTSIVNHVADSIYRIEFIKQHDREQVEIDHLNNLVELDSYFRIRRGLWMSMGGRVMFVSVLLFFSALQILRVYYPDLMLQEASDTLFISGIISLVLIRVAYKTMSLGLFLPPLRIGLILATPSSDLEAVSGEKYKLSKLELYSSKTKLNPILKDYYSDLSFEFEKGDRVQFVLEDEKEAFNLRTIFSGNSLKGRMTWHVKVNSKREKYQKWGELYDLPYVLRSNLASEVSIGELVSGLPKREIGESEINDIFTLLSKYKEFQFVFDLAKTTAVITKESSFTQSELALLQLAHCLYKKPEVIIVNEAWNLQQNQDVQSIIKLVETKLTESIILNFSSRDLAGFEANKVYTLCDGEVLLNKQR